MRRLGRAIGFLAIAFCGCTPRPDGPKGLTFFVAAPKPEFGFSQDELVVALEEAATAWRRSCLRHRLPLMNFRPGHAAEFVARDGRNVVRALSGRFCPDGMRDVSDCYEARRAAITHVYLPLDGTPADYATRFPEFDLELNAANFRWKEVGRDKLIGVLIHEIGHMLGLQHSCSFPNCGEEASRTVMYPYPLEPHRPTLLSPTQADCDALASVSASRRRTPSQRRERHELGGR